jgi:ABC-type hemin transport system ATPase subunit
MLNVICSVGSGKSSLLYSLTGEMRSDKWAEARPSLEINGEMALVN